MILVVVLVVLGISPERTTRITFIGVSTTGLSLRHTNCSQSDGLLANGPQIQFSGAQHRDLLYLEKRVWTRNPKIVQSRSREDSLYVLQLLLRHGMKHDQHFAFSLVGNARDSKMGLG